MSDLPTISLTDVISDADVEITNYPNYDPDGAQPRLFVGTLPASGELFASDGTPITAMDTEVTDRAIKYRPPKDENGDGLASFTLYGKDGTTDERSINGTDAVIFININAVNDPPLPTNIDDKVVLVGVDRHNIFTLGGTDVDDIIVGASISTFSLAGDLYDIESDGITFGSKLDSSGAGDVDLVSLKVGYKFTGNESNPDNTGFLSDDSFKFKLKDASNVKGVIGDAKFKAFTSLVALPVSNADFFTCVEDSADNVLLKGFDNSTTKRGLRYRIAELPAHGDLYDPADSATKLEVGSILAAVDSCPDVSNAATCYPGVRVLYMGNKNYFNFPTSMFNGSSINSEYDSFKYNAVVSASTNAKSLPKMQHVKVVNRNDRTEIEGPEEDIFVYALSSADRSEREKFCDIEDNKEKKECVNGGEARITGIKVTEVDKNVDRVRVSIKVRRKERGGERRQRGRGAKAVSEASAGCLILLFTISQPPFSSYHSSANPFRIPPITE